MSPEPSQGKNVKAIIHKISFPNDKTLLDKRGPQHKRGPSIQFLFVTPLIHLITFIFIVLNIMVAARI